jgi:hypothetical protein
MRQLPFILLVATSAVACVDSGTPADTAQVTSDLEKANGGLDTTDEAPMFADESAFDAASIEADAAYTDPMGADPTVTAMDQAPTVDGRDLILLWGRLPADPTATTVRDWSGRLELSRGALVVRRTIAFEERTDALLPRSSPRAIEFRSMTRPFADGLALRVLDPDPASTERLRLTYTSADGTRSYELDLSRLADGPIVVDAGDGNRVVAIGERRDDVCHGGFMRGRWHALGPNIGAYRGVVVNRLGEPLGHVRGIYGHRRNGDHVMFGKFIDRDGHFVGIIAGTYDVDGSFHARWLDRQGDHGTVRGQAFEGANPRGGGFLARWAETSCSEDP